MGAKTWMLIYADQDAKVALAKSSELDRSASEQFAKRLYPNEELTPLEDGDLAFACPPDDELLVGCFPGVSILAAKEFGIDYPSKLEQRFLTEGSNKTITLHAMHSVVDWFAFAQWKEGRLIRALSLSPDSGILEDFGPKFTFEEPYWAGERPADDEDDALDDEDSYPLPFHPLDLGEEVLKNLFGYQLEGFEDSSLLDPEEIPLACFKRKRSRWRFWR